MALGPHVHPFLDPAFDIPLPGTRSVAEKDMEIIRKRRDALIARAKGPAERNLEAGEGQVPVMMETTACESEKVPSLERCHGCGVSVTDAWRRGPDGPRSLCDICGVSFLSKKHEGILTWPSCITQN